MLFSIPQIGFYFNIIESLTTNDRNQVGVSRIHWHF